MPRILTDETATRILGDKREQWDAHNNDGRNQDPDGMLDPFGSAHFRQFGMSVGDFRCLNVWQTDDGFLRDYGITLTEYRSRIAQGENMGDSMVDGKFLPKRAISKAD